MADHGARGVITPQGFELEAEARAAARLLRGLTVHGKPAVGGGRFKPRPEVRQAFRHLKNKRVVVPRAQAGRLAGTTVVEAGAPPFPATRRVEAFAPPPAHPLYSYQTAAVDHVCRDAPTHVIRGRGVAYVQMGTGLGKTRFAIAVAARVGGPVFIVVPTKAIRLQWLEELAATYPGLRCAAYENGKAPAAPDTHDAVVGITNTVRGKEAGFFAGYSTLLLDEAHELHSPQNLKILWLAQGVPNVMGLSATPDDRCDGLDQVVGKFLGPPIWAEKDIPGFSVAGVGFTGRVREVHYAGDPRFCTTAVTPAGTVSAVETVGALVRDPARLELVASEVARLYFLHETAAPPVLDELGLGPRPRAAACAGHAEGGLRSHGVLVFAEHRDYLPALSAAIAAKTPPQALYVPEIEDPVVLRGGATDAQLRAAHQARIVLTTYGYSRRGVSIVEMTAIVLATPRRNGLRQILGRITRRGSDESIVRLVVDIKDTRSVLKTQSRDRRLVYKEKNYPIAAVRAAFGDVGGVAAAPEEAVWPLPAP